ncbi:hypothetical protein RvY_09039 [Ramazzottius varieornatus]|uniref:Uncharacterized protein n=1 Tax=Ramazzottius varieornatus TaxID=947166 RepID=A0A1D1VH54_RAMVA|nr:hypothetical protein RvY_09039 [Ramazzottius varieornatus]
MSAFLFPKKSRPTTAAVSLYFKRKAVKDQIGTKQNLKDITQRQEDLIQRTPPHNGGIA